MEENGLVIVFGALAILVFVYFVIKRNRKDQKELENEINQREVKPKKHDSESI